MNSAASIKPRIKQLARANWQCADAHLARCGKNAQQAYHRWLMASLREAATAASLSPPETPAPKKRGRPPRELMPMGWYAAKLAEAAASRTTDTGNPASPTTTLETAKLAKLRKIASSTSAPLFRQPGSAKPKKAGKAITIKAPPKAAPITQPKYHESIVRQVGEVQPRREYVPPTGLQKNLARASAAQGPLISISTGDRSAF